MTHLMDKQLDDIIQDSIKKMCDTLNLSEEELKETYLTCYSSCYNFCIDHGYSESQRRELALYEAIRILYRSDKNGNV